MVWIAKQLQNDYPNFGKWLKSEFPKVTANKKVWEAFRKWSGLGSEAKTYVGYGAMPEIRAETMTRGNGKFSPSKGDVIFLDTWALAYFEANYPSNPKDATRLVESTILHEMCHWAVRCGVLPLKKDDYGAKNVERGKHFERDAYDGDVNLIAVKGGGMVVVIVPFKKNPKKKH
jgi:hypothetical protein